MRVCLPLSLMTVVVITAGCHSANIEAVIRNRTDRPISLVEVDYPSASFGTQTLMPNQEFHYRFKVLGGGGSKVVWTDSLREERTQAGPALREGDEGSIAITFGASGPVWESKLTNHGERR